MQEEHYKTVLEERRAGEAVQECRVAGAAVQGSGGAVHEFQYKAVQEEQEQEEQAK